MRASVGLLLLSSLLAGCSGDGPSPEAVAERAIARLEADQGPDGEVESAESSIEVDIEGDVTVEVDATATITMYQGDKGRIDVGFEEVTVDGDEVQELAEFELMLFCEPERMVLQVEGNEAWGGNDVDVETENDAGACFGDDVNEDDMADSIARLALAAGEDGMAGSFLETFMETTPDPEYELVRAERAGDRIEAEYEVTDDGDTYTEYAVIEDGRIVSQSSKLEEDGVETDIETTYEYGPRDSAPEIRGAATV